MAVLAHGGIPGVIAEGAAVFVGLVGLSLLVWRSTRGKIEEYDPGRRGERAGRRRARVSQGPGRGPGPPIAFAYRKLATELSRSMNASDRSASAATMNGVITASTTAYSVIV